MVACTGATPCRLRRPIRVKAPPGALKGQEMQALCFFAGANSIFVGDTLLTAANPGDDRDSSQLRRLGPTPMALESGE
jgi:biotin synthase